jgi:hypothetical protein
MEHIFFKDTQGSALFGITSPYLLFLDDERMPDKVGNYINPFEIRDLYKNKRWIICRNFDEFTKCIIKNGLPSHISFDHDLGEDESKKLIEKGLSKRKARQIKKTVKTGYDAIKWLGSYIKDFNIELPICYVHSQNPVGKENIENFLKFIKKYE